MKKILFSILFLFTVFSVYSQQKAGLFNITTFPTGLSGNRFRVSGTFSDPSGQTVAANVDTSFVLWKGTARYTVDTIENQSGSSITMIVVDIAPVGFLTTGIANLGNVNEDGTINVSPTGDSNASYLSPASYSSLTRYNLGKTASKLHPDTIVQTINQVLGDTGWQADPPTGSEMVDSIDNEIGTSWRTGGVSDLGVGETVTVFSESHGFTMPDWNVIPIYQKNDSVFREANLLHKDSIYTLFIVDIPHVDSLTIQKSGYVTTNHNLAVGSYYMDFWNKISTAKDEYLEVKTFDILNDTTMALGNGLGIQYQIRSTQTSVNDKYAEVLEYADSNSYLQPSEEVRLLQNELIQELDDLGILDSLDYLYLFSNNGYQDFAKINIVNPLKHYAVEVNNIGFDNKKGFGTLTGGGALNISYINRVPPDGDAITSSQNNAGFGVYMTDLVGKNTKMNVSGINGGTRFALLSDVQRYSAALWSISGPIHSSYVPSNGFYFVKRILSTECKLYKDGTEVVTLASTSSSYTSGSQPAHYILSDVAGGIVSGSYYNVYVGIAFYGNGSIFTGKESSVNTLFQNYITAINNL